MAQEIVSRLKKASHAYYETTTPSMTDEEYDTLRERLAELDPTNPYLNEIGALPEVGRVALPFAMPSLRKIKPDTLDSIKLRGPFVITEKLDGISALWTYGINRNTGLYLRGNGLIGQDVTHVHNHVQGLPQGITTCTVRGELIVPRTESVARNWVNGVLHTSTPTKADCAKIHFVAYQVLEPKNLTRSQQMTWLKSQGFETATSYMVPALKLEELKTMFTETRKKSPYECDGIVIGTDTVPLVTTDALPKDAFAFKMAVEDQRAETTVLAIEWASSRLGEWIPRIKFQPVKIGSAAIEYCTGVHAQYIREHQLGPGARIVVRRSGDVIPALDRVITPAPAWQEPPEGRWKWDGVHAMDTTLEKTSDTLALEMAHSLISLGVEGLSATSTKKIVEGGYKSLNSLWKATEAQLQACIGKVSGSKLRTALDTIKPTQLQWIHAYPLWPKGYGERKIVKTLELEADVSKWPSLKVAPSGQSMTTFSEVCKHVPAYLVWREQFPQQQQQQHQAPPPHPLEPALPPPQFKGHYVMTGFRDAALTARLASVGWILQERINKETKVLLVADATQSVKTKTAKEKGIRIVLREEAQSLF